MPPKLDRNSPESVLDPILVHPTRILESVDGGPRTKPPEEQIKEVLQKLRTETGLSKEFSAEDAIGDPQAAIKEWQRLYGKKS